MQSNPTEALRDEKFRFGHKDLGPVVADYLGRLYAYIQAFEHDRHARTLFVSRAGIRIRRALDVFAKSAGRAPPASSEFFWVSRLMVAKGIWNRDRDAAIEIFSEEFRGAPLVDFVRAMFRFSPRGSKLKLVDRDLSLNEQSLGQFMLGSNQIAQMLRGFFEQQGRLFELYVKNVMSEATCALLVDTGWQGRTQTLLSRGFPEVDWWGAYFGRTGLTASDGEYGPKKIGIVFEGEQFDPRRPETCIILNRHLIEALFEPAGRSIEWMAEPQPGIVDVPDAQSVLADAPTRDSDPIFCGVLAYLEELQHANQPGELRRRASEAWTRLARMMIHPTQRELEMFGQILRSADFGRDIMVPVVRPAEPRFEGDTPTLRIKESLWPCGQAAVEFPPETAKQLQSKLAGVSPESSTKPRALQSARGDVKPRVAVITRTMDRPIFLSRALDSVARQTFQDYTHVVVSDGGDVEAVRAAILRSNADHARIRLVDAIVNRGMEAASNLAIRSCESDYIVIHDDDDTWEPTFLQKTVSFMDGPNGKLYGGVITRSTYCSEEVTPTGVVVRARSSYNDAIENVHLAEMAIGNCFPPISFLFRRAMWEKLDGFNEEYPVLGDWDFNLRFLIEADIAVIGELLANYHHRDRGNITAFGNSVIAARDKHAEYSSIVRNNFVRNLVQRGNSAAATLVGMGVVLADQRATTRASHQRLLQIGRDTSDVAARLNAMDASKAWGDNYWLAFQHVLKALAENDTEKLDQIAAMASGSGNSAASRVMSLVRQARSPKSRAPAHPINIERAAAQLLKEVIELQAGPIRDLLIPPDFDEPTYLRQNPDVAALVADGVHASGYEHYLRFGRSEGRQRPQRR